MAADNPLKYTTGYAHGEYNADVEIEANREGIELDIGILIPWEWIDKAQSIIGASKHVKWAERLQWLKFAHSEMTAGKITPEMFVGFCNGVLSDVDPDRPPVWPF